jgi:hypothetical protein
MGKGGLGVGGGGWGRAVSGSYGAQASLSMGPAEALRNTSKQKPITDIGL